MKKGNLVHYMWSISLVAIFLLSSCSTALMKTSPFYTGKIITGKTSSGQIVRWDDPDAVKIEKVFAHNIKARMDDERIYVWPLFYKNFLLYSVLWPLAEVNDVGWEVRPIISADNYNKEYRILTGGWNGKNGANYIFPFYAKDESTFVSLPFSYKRDGSNWIYNYMLFAGYFTEDRSSFLAPLYYYDGTDERLYTPICSFGKDSGYILPLYFYEKNYNGENTKDHYFLPPFGKVSYDSYNGDSYCKHARFAPLFFYNCRKMDDQCVNPKYRENVFADTQYPSDYWIDGKSTRESVFVLPSLYFSENKEKKKRESIIFPFYFFGYNKYKDHNEEWRNLFPFYFSGYDKSYKGTRRARDKEWVAAFPFFTYNRNKKDISRSFMVIGGNQEKEIWGKKYSSSYILPFYFYNYSPGGEQSVVRNSFIFPSILGTEYDNKKYNSFTVFPFYFKGYDKRYGGDSEWLNIFPAYFYSRDEENVYKNYGMIAGTRDEKILNKKYQSSYIFPFYNYRYCKVNNYVENPKYRGEHFTYKNRPQDLYINKPTIAKKSYVFPTIYSNEYENGNYCDKMIFPFYRKGFDKQNRDDKEWVTVFPFYAYERDKKDVSNNYMILGGTSEKNIAGKQYSSSYILPFYYNGYRKNIDYETNPKYRDQNLKYSERPDDYYLEKESAENKTYIFPNLFMSENRAKKESSYTFFPFLFNEKTPEYEKTGSPFSIYQRRESFINDNLHLQFLWYMYYYDRDSSGVSKYIFPSYYSYTNRVRNHTVTNFFPFTFHEKTDSLDSFGTFLWLYTSRNYLKEKKVERQFFWYLYYNQKYAADKERGIENYESSRILWKAYHRETKGDVTNVDIFPFISYSKNKKRSKLSFAYRFFSVETGENGTKIHLLFLPVWW